ncbi:MAG: hypothetical protein HMLKMBBP_00717 [Planctomycetes bacterium]|nr:hypothetical protein [Planctomycetota bacterium]
MYGGGSGGGRSGSGGSRGPRPSPVIAPPDSFSGEESRNDDAAPAGDPPDSEGVLALANGRSGREQAAPPGRRSDDDLREGSLRELIGPPSHPDQPQLGAPETPSRGGPRADAFDVSALTADPRSRPSVREGIPSLSPKPSVRATIQPSTSGPGPLGGGHTSAVAPPQIDRRGVDRATPRPPGGADGILLGRISTSPQVGGRGGGGDAGAAIARRRNETAAQSADSKSAAEGAARDAAEAGDRAKGARHRAEEHRAKMASEPHGTGYSEKSLKRQRQLDDAAAKAEGAYARAKEQAERDAADAAEAEAEATKARIEFYTLSEQEQARAEEAAAREDAFADRQAGYDDKHAASRAVREARQRRHDNQHGRRHRIGADGARRIERRIRWADQEDRRDARRFDREYRQELNALTRSGGTSADVRAKRRSDAAVSAAIAKAATDEAARARYEQLTLDYLPESERTELGPEGKLLRPSADSFTDLQYAETRLGHSQDPKRPPAERKEAARVSRAASARVAARAREAAEKLRTASTMQARALRQLGSQGSKSARRAAAQAIRAAASAARKALKSSMAAEQASKYGTEKQAHEASKKADEDAAKATAASRHAEKLLKEAILSAQPKEDPQEAPKDGQGKPKFTAADLVGLSLEQLLLTLHCGGLCRCTPESCAPTHHCESCKWKLNDASIGGGGGKIPDNSAPLNQGGGSGPPPAPKEPEGGRAESEDGAPEPETDAPPGSRYAPPRRREVPPGSGPKKSGGALPPDSGGEDDDGPKIKRIAEEIGKKVHTYSEPREHDYIKTEGGPDQPWIRTTERWRYPCSDDVPRAIYFREGPSAGTYVVYVWVGRNLLKSAPISKAELATRYIGNDKQVVSLCDLLMEPGVVDRRTAFNDAVADLMARMSDRDRAFFVMMLGKYTDVGLMETLERQFHGEAMTLEDAWNIGNAVLPDAAVALLKKAGKTLKDGVAWFFDKLRGAKAGAGDDKVVAEIRDALGGGGPGGPRPAGAQPNDAPTPTPSADASPTPPPQAGGPAHGPEGANAPPVPPPRPQPPAPPPPAGPGATSSSEIKTTEPPETGPPKPKDGTRQPGVQNDVDDASRRSPPPAAEPEGRQPKADADTRRGDTASGEADGADDSGSKRSAYGRVPQGLTETQFNELSQTVRSQAGHLGDDIAVHGSRASGSATVASDIDISIRTSSADFDALVRRQFGDPTPGTAKWRTMQHAIKTGKIQAGEAGLRPLRKALEQKLGMDVDISVVRTGGPFDNGPYIPLAR